VLFELCCTRRGDNTTSCLAFASFDVTMCACGRQVLLRHVGDVGSGPAVLSLYRCAFFAPLHLHAAFFGSTSLKQGLS